MAFTSIEFLVFVIAGVALYYAIPEKVRYIAMLVFSYVFYLSAGVGVLKYILFTTLTTYTLTLAIGKVSTSALDKTKKRFYKKLFAGIALVLNFGLLYVLKYWNFTLDTLGVSEALFRINVILPLGISFYIFQSMGYVVDVTREKFPPEKNLLKLSLFVAFFPQLTQGPIGRYTDLAPQLYRGRRFCFDNVKEGTKLIFRGYVKKLIVADRASVPVNAIIESYQNYSGSVILFGILLYSIQLYCDFSGGIDIARGVAKLFGIDMAENFKRPFFATSLADFWRRWHITLGSWLKDYLFYPITLSKPMIKLSKFLRTHLKGRAGKIIPTSIATFIVYLVVGLWHGANFKYVLYGCWNGAIITGALLLEPLFSKIPVKRDTKLWHAFSIFRTLIIVTIGRYMTRALGVGACFEMLSKTLTSFDIKSLSSVLTLGITGVDYAVIFSVGALILLLEYFEEKGECLSVKIERKSSALSFIFMTLSILFFIYFALFRGSYIASEFIYKQF